MGTSVNHAAKMRGELIRLSKILRDWEQGAKRFKEGTCAAQIRDAAERVRLAGIATELAEAFFLKDLTPEARAAKVRLAMRFIEEMPGAGR